MRRPALADPNNAPSLLKLSNRTVASQDVELGRREVFAAHAVDVLRLGAEHVLILTENPLRQRDSDQPDQPTSTRA